MNDEASPSRSLKRLQAQRDAVRDLREMAHAIKVVDHNSELGRLAEGVEGVADALHRMSTGLASAYYRAHLKPPPVDDCDHVLPAPGCRYCEGT